jgi:dephospho-CoA kinase
MKIALLGYARTGKDTIYELIKKHHDYGTRRIAFGDVLRDSFHEMFDIPRSPKPREGYEKYGKAMREIEKDVWVKALSHRYQKLLTYGFEDFVVTDLRQPNEAEWAKQNGFVLVRVDADVKDRQERSASDTNYLPINPSETEIENIHPDWVIRNNGSLEDLEKAVINLLQIMEGIDK